MIPLNDKLKIKIQEAGPFGDPSNGVEKGIVEQVPDKLAYFGFHSFAFEQSVANDKVLEKIHAFYKELEGKLVFWTSLQDRGRRFKVGDDEYVFINMTDIIAYSDNLELDVTLVDQTGSAGSFNL